MLDTSYSIIPNFSYLSFTQMGRGSAFVIHNLVFLQDLQSVLFLISPIYPGLILSEDEESVTMRGNSKILLLFNSFCEMPRFDFWDNFKEYIV